ncbi:hypothetical protein C4M96_02605 [Mycoplasmopsis pullorum]|uniref:hypothetical protein n=1 Tax=Mycoplasmopsis pullorum TaxID=48003 RepID=UPI00111B6C69|nr:hypothetical protein [Mycoplasmopsis pullorum]TNK82835.1 hypothetical protein C4M93_03465 [Mycoplasmopsis pullorum]TNK91988.1 hypothetical protein C4M96_02605 [Mycoplasmopsis pullorum]
MILKFNYYTATVAIAFFLIHFIYYFVYRFIKLHAYKDSNLKLKLTSIALAKEILFKQNCKRSLKFSNNYFLNWNQEKWKILVLPKTNNSFNDPYYSFTVVSRAFLASKFTKTNTYLEYSAKWIWFIFNLNIIWTLVFNLWIISIILFVLNIALFAIVLFVNQKVINLVMLSTLEFLQWQVSTQEDYETVNSVALFYRKEYLNVFLSSLLWPISSFGIWFKNLGKDE